MERDRRWLGKPVGACSGLGHALFAPYYIARPVSRQRDLRPPTHWTLASDHWRLLTCPDQEDGWDPHRPLDLGRRCGNRALGPRGTAVAPDSPTRWYNRSRRASRTQRSFRSFAMSTISSLPTTELASGPID